MRGLLFSTLLSLQATSCAHLAPNHVSKDSHVDDDDLVREAIVRKVIAKYAEPGSLAVLCVAVEDPTGNRAQLSSALFSRLVSSGLSVADVSSSMCIQRKNDGLGSLELVLGPIVRPQPGTATVRTALSLGFAGRSVDFTVRLADGNWHVDDAP